MPRLLDPSTTVAVILGAHDWTRAGLSKALSFRRSAAHLHAFLIGHPPHGLGFEPDQILNLFDDPSSSTTQLGRIRDTITGLVRERQQTPRPITDVFIYYIGHGTAESGKQLHCLVRDSTEGIEEQSSIGAAALAHVLRIAAPQQRRLVVLDCCFSEAAAEAFGAMSQLDDAVATTALKDLEPEKPPPERGTVLLCSSPRRRASIGSPDAEFTLFTGSLLRVLREGPLSPRSEWLSFSDLRDEIYERMIRTYDGAPPRPALHQTDQADGDLTSLSAFPNVLFSQAKLREREAAAAKVRQERQAAIAAEKRRKQQEAAAAEQEARRAAAKAEKEREAALEARRLRKQEAEEKEAAAAAATKRQAALEAAQRRKEQYAREAAAAAEQKRKAALEAQRRRKEAAARQAEAEAETARQAAPVAKARPQHATKASPPAPVLEDEPTPSGGHGVLWFVLGFIVTNTLGFFAGKYLAILLHTWLPMFDWLLKTGLLCMCGGIAGGLLSKTFKSEKKVALILAAASWPGYLIGFRFLSGLPPMEQPSVWYAIASIIAYIASSAQDN